MPKNIVLCSDGTGNARGRSIGTNVGRIFKAVDLTKGQVAFYDDGVGTEKNKYLRMLGGAFGLGLKRNVVDMYEFLCRNYQHRDANGVQDQIYVFGFSRGAYTARALAGLVGACGIVDTSIPTNDSLRDLANKAYCAYRKNRTDKRSAEVFRADWSYDRKVDKEAFEGGRIRIRFIGVWDTVDAVGMPIDELATAMDHIFNYRFTDNKLGRLVDKGCHAVAIDDERHTFHPVMWSGEDDNNTVEHDVAGDGKPRAEQILFSGVHSNVGGGYPKDELSYVSLQWMMVKAAQYGLKFISSMRNGYEDQINPNGRIYDSRAGLALFYRFKPRNFYDLKDEFKLGAIRVHESVLARIFGNVVDYNPHVLPTDITVVNNLGDRSSHFADEQLAIKAHSLELKSRFKYVAEISWWRRLLHAFGIMGLLAFVTIPFWVPDAWISGACGGLPCVFEPLLGLLRLVSGGSADPVAKSLSHHPPAFYGFLVAVSIAAALFFFFRNRTAVQQAEAWRSLKAGTITALKLPLYCMVSNWIRTNDRAKQLAGIFGTKIFPWLFFLLPVLYVMLTTAQGISIVSGDVCDPKMQALNKKADTEYVTSNPCVDTGVELAEGAPYVLTVRRGMDWLDSTIPAPAPNGFKSDKGSALMNLFVPWRRHPTARWFQLVGKIGDGDPFMLEGKTVASRMIDVQPVTGAAEVVDTTVSTEIRFTANGSGNLQVYVNDAICYLCPDPWIFYSNNTGDVCVSVRHAETGKELGATCRAENTRGAD